MGAAVPFKPEANANISILRWKRFVEAEDAQFLKIVEAFTKATGVKVNVSNESFDDIQPKASVAANTGQGPDMVWGLHSLPHLFPRQVPRGRRRRRLPRQEIRRLGSRRGATGQSKASGSRSRSPSTAATSTTASPPIEKAGFKTFPADTAGFLELCRAMKKNNTPAGFALGHASGDGNAWMHWLLWSHGSYLVDKNEKVILNSPETAQALEYAKQLYETFIPGTASWNDLSNNKAFLAGELYLTANGISIYATAKAPEMTAIAEDMDHALLPVGPVGKPQELQLCFPLLTFNFTKYPQAARRSRPSCSKPTSTIRGWRRPPATSPSRSTPTTATRSGRRTRRTRVPRRRQAHAARQRHRPGQREAAAAISDFILVDMVANYCTGREDVKGAIARPSVRPSACSAERSSRRGRAGRIFISDRGAPIAGVPQEKIAMSESTPRRSARR